MKANNLQVFTKALVLSFGKSGMTISVPEFDLMDLKINFMDFNQIRDVSLNEEKTKLSIKVSSHKNKRKHHKIRHEFLDKEEEEEEAGDVFWRKFEFEVYFFFFKSI